MNMNYAQYAVLSLRPYPNRTEHLNYGIVVFEPTGAVSIHLLKSLRKLTCLAPTINLSDLRDNINKLQETICQMTPSQAFEYLQFIKMIPSQIPMNKLGKFSYNPGKSGHFAEMIKLCLDSQCVPMTEKGQSRSPNKSKLFNEVKKQFDLYDMLAKIDDNANRRVITNYYPYEDADLMVDFAIKNDVLHIAQTMDLRTNHKDEISSHHKQEAYSKILSIIVTMEDKSIKTKSHLVVAGLNSPAANRVIDPFIDRVNRITVWENQRERSEFFSEWMLASGRHLPELPMH